jgi:hypothetical protein
MPNVEVTANHQASRSKKPLRIATLCLPCHSNPLTETVIGGLPEFVIGSSFALLLPELGLETLMFPHHSRKVVVA